MPGAHHHAYRYTRRDILRLCRGAGLECRLVRRYGVLPRNLWHRAPARLRDAPAAARLWDAADTLLGLPLAAVAQNWLFAARRPAGAAGPAP